MATTFSDAITFQAAVAFRGGATGLSRSSLAQDDLKHYPIIPTAWRVWDAYGTILPATSAADDLGIYAGAFATGCPYVGTGDVKTLTTTRYARTTFQLPPEYVAGARVQIRAHGGMVTTTAGTSATVDFEAFKLGLDTLISGSDLCATAAQSINSLTFAAKDFSVTPTTLSPGDWLDIRATIATVDAASGTAVIAALAAVQVLLDIQG